MEKFLTIKAAAKLLGVSPLTLRNWDKSGKLVAHRNPLNNYRVYKLSQIEQFLEELELSRRRRRFKIKVISEEQEE
jgi:excisionase family DNA binding protein